MQTMHAHKCPIEDAVVMWSSCAVAVVSCHSLAVKLGLPWPLCSRFWAKECDTRTSALTHRPYGRRFLVDPNLANNLTFLGIFISYNYG